METLIVIQNFLTTHVELIAFLFGSLGISAALQKLKHKLEIENPKLMLTITSTLSFATAALPALMGWLSTNPEVLGAYTAFVFMFTQICYRWVVQPTSAFLADYSAYKTARKAGITDIQAEVNVQVTPKIEAPKPAKDFEG